MLKSAVFPYGITLQEGGKVDIFPAAEVLFSSKEGEWLSLFLIIDSGASVSAFPKSDARAFGIDLDKDSSMQIYGIGKGPISGWKHKLRVRLGSNEFWLPVVFLDNYNGPRILGREGVFDRFLLIFDEEKQKTGFIGKSAKESKDIRKIMNKIK